MKIGSNQESVLIEHTGNMKSLCSKKETDSRFSSHTAYHTEMCTNENKEATKHAQIATETCTRGPLHFFKL